MEPTQLTFRARFFGNLGDELFVCGNHPSLNMYDHNKAIPLFTDPTNYPWWTTKELLIFPKGLILRFRYCLHVNGKFTAWIGEEETIECDATVVTSYLNPSGQISPSTSSTISKRLSISTSGATTRNSFDLKSPPTQYPAAGSVFTPNMTSFASPSSLASPGSQFHSPAPNLSFESDFVMVVAYFLPVIVTRSLVKKNGWIVEWDHDALLSLQSDRDVSWVGVVRGIFVESPDESESLSRALSVFHCYPVFIDKITHDLFYEAFCKGILWPSFHQVVNVYGSLDSLVHPVESAVPSVLHVDSIDEMTVTTTEAMRELNAKLVNLQVITDFSSSLSKSPLNTPSNKRKTMKDLASLCPGDRLDYLWSVYTDVNMKFKSAMAEVYHSDNTLVWIHDLYLLLLPSFISRTVRKSKGNRIGFYFHTPFPASEIFRTVLNREAILQAVLNCDQIGFLDYQYSRHFTTCCRRMLGYQSGVNSETGQMTVNVEGRDVTIVCMHAGVDSGLIASLTGKTEFFRAVTEIRRALVGGSVNADRRSTSSPSSGSIIDVIANNLSSSSSSSSSDSQIIIGIDRLECLKSIPLQLLGFERLLKSKPDVIGRLRYIQIGISAPERGLDYAKTQRDVERLVHRININILTHHSQQCNNLAPVIYFEMTSICLADRLRLFGASDYLVVGVAREGLNNIPVEFSCAHDALMKSQYQDSNRKSLIGVNLLAHNAACHRVSAGAIMLNPWVSDNVAKQIYLAMHLSEEEKLTRFRKDIIFSTRLPIDIWALVTLRALKQVSSGIEYENNAFSSVGGLLGKTGGNIRLGFGLTSRNLRMNTSLRLLEEREVGVAYKKSKQRLLIFDYGGTLVAQADKFCDFAEPTPLSAQAGSTTSSGQLSASSSSYNLLDSVKSYDGKRPTAKTLNLLKILTQDTANVIFVISGRDMNSLEDAFKSVPGIGLAAESGFYYTWPRDFLVDAFSPKTQLESKKTTAKRNWKSLFQLGDRRWMTIAKKIMNVYVNRTHGSYFEMKRSAVLWQYGDADTEFGHTQARELEDHLNFVLKSFAVDIIGGGRKYDRWIEVRPKGVGKGLFLKHVLDCMDSDSMDSIRKQSAQQVATGELYSRSSSDTSSSITPAAETDKTASGVRLDVDFLFVMGDDESDEPMFAYIKKLQTHSLYPKMWKMSCSVGLRATYNATTYVNETSDVSQLLDSLANLGNQHVHRSVSSADLAMVGNKKLMPKGSMSPMTPADEYSANSNTLDSRRQSDGRRPPLMGLRFTLQESLSIDLDHGGKSEDVFFHQSSADRARLSPFSEMPDDSVESTPRVGGFSSPRALSPRARPVPKHHSITEWKGTASDDDDVTPRARLKRVLPPPMVPIVLPVVLPVVPSPVPSPEERRVASRMILEVVDSDDVEQVPECSSSGEEAGNAANEDDDEDGFFF